MPETPGDGGLPDEETAEIRNHIDKSRNVAAIRELREHHPRITALAAVHDSVAVRTLSALETLSVRVPQELAVLGFGNSDFGAWLPLPLTTVDIPTEAFGRQTARKILGTEPEDAPVPSPHVIIRETA
ncbi:substrate-binding domain-containing protein [Nesterenkonia alba]|uniref:substrate-binding domain-containing protein n=1 Tax=Nesterenkonia alba TaxID=515814 RepID=UPI00146B7EF4